ncbi:anti-silencing function 1 [Tribonema minus]|uniref:Anti-silencing function 1 n=1 Tax=Tribonema minus TaxID=303371 RepID=A0A835ZH43_9STRA|nr:anti-silencing function 1 [Tribonema minus]
MALVILKNVEVLDNPAPFLSPLKFDITFECQQALEEDLEWKVIYVGSAEDSKRDQVLDEIMVGPVSVGTMRFTMETDAPDPSKIPQEDLKGVTVVLLQCLYRGNEFVRVGYYVNNEMPEEAAAAAEAAKADPLAHQAQQNQLMQQSASMFRAIVEGGSAVEQHDSLMQTATVTPAPPTIDIPADPTKLVRNILSDKPRVTRFSIDWRPAGAMDVGGDDTMSGLPPMDDVQGRYGARR